MHKVIYVLVFILIGSSAIFAFQEWYSWHHAIRTIAIVASVQSKDTNIISPPTKYYPSLEKRTLSVYTYNVVLSKLVDRPKFITLDYHESGFRIGESIDVLYDPTTKSATIDSYWLRFRKYILGLVIATVLFATSKAL
jgi:hypothetical protein